MESSVAFDTEIWAYKASRLRCVNISQLILWLKETSHKIHEKKKKTDKENWHDAVNGNQAFYKLKSELNRIIKPS
jgi:hypothetical protein